MCVCGRHPLRSKAGGDNRLCCLVMGGARLDGAKELILTPWASCSEELKKCSDLLALGGALILVGHLTRVPTFLQD
jgi:hypothetical protein